MVGDHIQAPCFSWLSVSQAIPARKHYSDIRKRSNSLQNSRYRNVRCPSCTCKISTFRLDLESANRQVPRMPLSPARIAKPKTTIQKDTKKLVAPPKQEELTETGSGAARAKPKRKTEQEFVPMYKVILLGDEEYDQVAVVQALLKVIPKMEQAEARRIFHEAQSTGESIICIVEKEHAEFYTQQLKREEVYVRMEEA